jgi:hypothetical protein
VLELPGRNGGAVVVHPLQFALLTRDREVRKFQVVQEGESVLILFVPRHSASNEIEGGCARPCRGNSRSSASGSRASRWNAART